MKIFISSITSYIGSNLARYLINNGYEVYGTYRQSYGYLSEYVNNTLLNISKLNYTYESIIPKDDNEYDILINSTGAYPSPGVSTQDIVSANIKSAAYINSIIKNQNKVPIALINYSTLSVYGNLATKVINKDTKVSPIDIYGSSKLMAEQLHNEELSKEIPIVHIRFPVVLGKGAHRAWLPRLLEKIISTKSINLYNPNSLYSTCTTLLSVIRFTEFIFKNPPKIGPHECTIGAIPDMTIMDIFTKLANEFEYSKDPIIIDSNNPCCLLSSDIASKIGYQIPLTSYCIDYWIQESKKY